MSKQIEIVVRPDPVDSVRLVWQERQREKDRARKRRDNADSDRRIRRVRRQAA